MKRLFFILMLTFGIVNSYSQVNRYDTGVNYDYISTYVPIDFDFLLKAAKMSREVSESQKRTLELINEVENIYIEFPKYPSFVTNGWHEVICIAERKIIYQAMAYTSNNQIIKLNLNNETFDTKDGLTVVNGRCLVPGLVIYFLEDIKIFNK